MRAAESQPTRHGQSCAHEFPPQPLHLYRAKSFKARLLGLHGRPRLRGREGLWLHPCRAIHTFGLPQQIDVVFLDEELYVLETRLCLPPWRVAFCRRACSVVELPGGYCQGNPHYPDAIRQALVE